MMYMMAGCTTASLQHILMGAFVAALLLVGLFCFLGVFFVCFFQLKSPNNNNNFLQANLQESTGANTGHHSSGTKKKPLSHLILVSYSGEIILVARSGKQQKLCLN